LVELACKNSTRAKLYHALSKKVKVQNVVKDVLNPQEFWAIYRQVAQIELAGLFGSTT
jgi:hypothetical protein